jgi:hypothetical protein
MARLNAALGMMSETRVPETVIAVPNEICPSERVAARVIPACKRMRGVG